MALGGRYRLVRQIAVGGMGEVWVAHDESLARDVAVKVLREEFAGNSDFLDRLRTEARNSAALSHSNIAQLYDYGEQQGSGYLVMELVHGEPMSDLLEREPVLPVLRLLSILSQTARALHAAHVAGVVHRDVKPGNILLERSGEVKITDFGVSLAANQVPMTAAGMVMGTAQYLSPEQAIGKAATGASDIYALGIVAYESIVGSRPFTGATPVDIAVAQVNETVPPLPATVHPGLSDLVMRMLAKDPLDRPRSGAILARTFDLLADEIAADPWGNGRRRRDPAPSAARREAPPTAGVPSISEPTSPGADVASAAVVATTPDETRPVRPQHGGSAHGEPAAVHAAPPGGPTVHAPVHPTPDEEQSEPGPVGRRMLVPSPTENQQGPRQPDSVRPRDDGSHAAAPARSETPRPAPAPASPVPGRAEQARPAHHATAPGGPAPTQWEPHAPAWDTVQRPRAGQEDRGSAPASGPGGDPTGSVRRRVPHPGTTDRSRTTPVAGTPRASSSSTPRTSARPGAGAVRRGTTGTSTAGHGSPRRTSHRRRPGLRGLLDSVRSLGRPTLALVFILVVVLTATLAKALLDSSGSGESTGSGHLSGTISLESTGGTGLDAMIVGASGSQSPGAASPTTPKDT